MYTVYSDSVCLMDPSKSILLIDPILELAQNEVGSFSFSLTTSHVAYEQIVQSSRITVFKDEDAIFYGRVSSIETDFYKTKTITADGELSYLADSIQRPAEYHNQSVRGFIQTLLNNHNEQCEEKFDLGVVNISDPNDSLYRYTNYESTLFCLLDKVIGRLGGMIAIRHQDGHRYLDILNDYPRACRQMIRFKENLMDFVCSSSSDQLATVVIPLGATVESRSIEALEERVSIASVNGGKDYIESPSAIAKYGRICKVVTYDDIHTSSLLKTEGQEYLDHQQFEDLQLEISAVDLSILDVNVDDFRLLDRIRVQSDYHDMDEVFPLTSMRLHLLQPDQNLYHLGGKPASFTSSTSSAQVSITQKVQAFRTPNSLLEEAKEQATQLLTTFGKYGHVVQVQDEQGQIQEICIIDTEDLETAQNVWRWNMGGLGFSSNGYAGPYETAMTMDGTIAGNMVAANSIAAEKLDISYRTSVEQNISDSLAAAKADTSEKLKAYWTQVETESRITNAMDSISLAVYQRAVDYTDGQMKTKLAEYYTKSEIDIKTDAINLSVSQHSTQISSLSSSQASLQLSHDNLVTTVSNKVGTSEVASYIQQNAESVRIAWSNISNYIEFSGGTINIFSAASKTSVNRLMQLGQSGMSFWRDGYNLGKIGVNAFADYPSSRGLVFDLDPDGAYMAWAAKISTGGNYIVQMLYANKSFGSYVRDHLYFSCEVDFFDNSDYHNHHLYNCNLQQPDIVNRSGYSGFGSWSSPTSIKLPSSINSDGTVQEWYNCTISGGVIY